MWIEQTRWVGTIQSVDCLQDLRDYTIGLWGLCYVYVMLGLWTMLGVACWVVVGGRGQYFIRSLFHNPILIGLSGLLPHFEWEFFVRGGRGQGLDQCSM